MMILFNRSNLQAYVIFQYEVGGSLHLELVQSLTGLRYDCVVVEFHVISFKFRWQYRRIYGARGISRIAQLKSFGTRRSFVTIHIVAPFEKDMICNIMK